MSGILALPLDFLYFWYVLAPKGLLAYLGSLNSAFLQLLSLPLFVRTFFKPLKNEYRDGLVRFSLIMGIFLKSILILVDLSLFLILLIFELAALLVFLAFPILTFWLLFVK